MATDAIIVTSGSAPGDGRLARILEYFGVAVRAVAVDDLVLASRDDREAGSALFSSIDTFVSAIQRPHSAEVFWSAAAIYLFANVDRESSQRALRKLEGWETSLLVPVGTETCAFSVSSELGDLDGPMAGITVSARPRAEDCALTLPADTNGAVAPLLSANGRPVFVRFQHHGVPVFLCTSAAVVNIDQPVAGPFFDIKDHFCSAVPLAMFLTWAFRRVMWRPLDAGACLIVDDPLLKPTYGFCDFRRLLELMNLHDFTTNIAFIPWNWRRTSARASIFFRGQPSRFSVSIHGCDHTASEFGDASVERLEEKASLARLRMQRHQSRTGIAHDSIMVFPQGVFSSRTAGVLKRNGFTAAVNTEVNPVDAALNPTLVREVWDVANRQFDSFPIFTRRYAFHGIENFAFDLLIGKPCLIVSHHEFFKNDCAEVIGLVEKLNALKGPLTWRALGEVVRRAGRRRRLGPDSDEIEMYGSEVTVTNESPRPLCVVVRKKENDAALVTRVRGDRGDLKWERRANHIEFRDTIPPGQEAHFAIAYAAAPARRQPRRPVRFEAVVAARRLLSEIRDEYWQKLRRS